MTKFHNFSSSIWFLVLQWVYAFWQAVRNTKGFNLCYYGLQWLLTSGGTPKKRIIWVNKDYQALESLRRPYGPYKDWQEFKERMLGKQDNGIHYLSFEDCWYQVEYNHKYYWVHQDVFFEVSVYKLSECVFVKDLYHLDQKYSVAQQISEEEAMLMMFNRDMHFYPVEERTVIYGREFNMMEYNSKLSGFLATIPLILQARKLSGASSLASLLLLLIDFFRTPLYRGYDQAFFHLTKFMKLYVFQKRTWLYSLFGLFSNRWRYSDFNKGYAYMTQGEELEVISYVSMLGRDDCTLVTSGDHITFHPKAYAPHFTIRNSIVSSAQPWQYIGDVSLFRINKKIFVS
ncbi:hypothetical protein SELMODRAFT_430302 [Selaginella moellendorffii]|uniref:Uncharacterized protein n=1 Tax=Selaginella moellendorffii TaxID=88036 RepID=D8T8Z3_SELML|nr:hypothetical protein SELMODRAFT_430302 [Selaginella moellendorffii]